MFKAKHILILLIGIVFLMSLCPVFSASVPIPEDYGIYLVAGGRLKEMPANIIDGFDGSPARVFVNVDNHNPTFIIYQGNINRVFMLKLIGVPPQEGEQEIQTKVSPINGNPNMLKITPRGPLPPGNYCIGAWVGLRGFLVYFKIK